MQWTDSFIQVNYRLQVYTDSIRRAAEQYGLESPEVFQAMHDIDDVMQGILTDIESKRERAGIKVIKFDAT